MLVKSPLKKEHINKKARKKAAPSRPGKLSPRKDPNGSSYGKRIQPKGQKKKGFSFPKLKPWKVIVGAVILGAAGVFYLSHVFATQKLLGEVNRLEREYHRVKRMHSEFRLKYDRMIGPTEIYEKAKRQGLINGGPAEKVIEVEK